MKKNIFYIATLIVLIFSCQKEIALECSQGDGLINYPVIAHSHNDYEHAIPIYDAQNRGFTSLEVDIIHDGKQIRISHDDKKLNSKPLFEDDYLSPLLNELLSNPKELILLVDIKKYSELLLLDLKTILDKYKENLVTRKNILDVENKVRIILSGDIPRAALIDDESNEYIFVDGRNNDADINAPSDIVPIISIDFTDITSWKGILKLSNSTRINLENVIESVHAKGKLIRFWKTKDREAVWLTLIDLEVDVIGVDETDKFCSFMHNNGFVQ